MIRTAAPWGLALGGVVLLGATAAAGPFWGPYLAAITLWSALPLGALALLAANHLMGGKWGPLVARTLLPAIHTLPWTGLLFVPVLLAQPEIWPWARPGGVPDGPGKALWFAPEVFAARTVAYFTLWTVLARWLAGRPAALGPWPRRLPAAVTTLAAHVVIGSLAGVDWLLSLDPAFNSSIFGLRFLSHQVAGALAFAVAVSLLSGEAGGRTDKLGALLLAAVIAWSYFAAMDYLVVWSADLPHEAAWYLRRRDGGWRAVSWAMVALHTAVPVLALMWRRIRLVPGRLAAVSLVVLLGFVLDGLWLAGPEFPAAGPVGLAGATAGVGLVWLAAFAFFRVRLSPPPRP